jgi:hypothetical protein
LTEPVFIHPAGRERLPEDRCIVSCGIGEKYVQGLASTRAHCTVHDPDSWQLFYSYYPKGCPPQEEQQYAFKIYALQRAIAAGFRHVLWMDATFQPVDSLEPLWERVKGRGWYVPPQQGAMLDRFCSDSALSIFGINRETAAKIPLVYSGIVGFDLHSVIGLRLWLGWQRLYDWGAFNGAHRNEPGMHRHAWGDKFAGHVSDDPSVEGHRHDEAALSYVLHSWGLLPEDLGFLTYETPNGFIDHHVPLDYSKAVRSRVCR